MQRGYCRVIQYGRHVFCNLTGSILNACSVFFNMNKTLKLVSGALFLKEPCKRWRFYSSVTTSWRLYLEVFTLVRSWTDIYVTHIKSFISIRPLLFFSISLQHSAFFLFIAANTQHDTVQNPSSLVINKRAGITNSQLNSSSISATMDTVTNNVLTSSTTAGFQQPALPRK